MFDPTYPLFPIFAFLGFITAIIPLPWHLQAWNSGTCYYMMWAALACLNQFVNSVVWANDALNIAPVWCEISIRIMLGSSVGLPAASLCINRRLYHIANSRAVTISPSEKRRAILIDTLICVVFPLVFIALQYVVQGHRFNIFEGIGCYPALYNTLLTYFISSMWPIVIGVISAVYCVLSLRSFARRRIEFGQFLSSNKSLTVSRYFRLMALATTEILFTTPLAIFMIWLNATAAPIGPWRSWDDTHFAFSRIEQFPAVLWRANHLTVVAMEFSRWVTPLCALVFFAFFGFADEAQKNYRIAFRWLTKPFGLRPLSMKSSSNVLSIGQYKRKSHTFGPISSPLPSYSSPSTSTVFNQDTKSPISPTSSITDTIVVSPTKFSSPDHFSATHHFPVVSITENSRHTHLAQPHDYYDLESQYTTSSVPSTPSNQTRNIGVAS